MCQGTFFCQRGTTVYTSLGHPVTNTAVGSATFQQAAERGTGRFRLQLHAFLVLHSCVQHRNIELTYVE